MRPRAGTAATGGFACTIPAGSARLRPSREGSRRWRCGAEAASGPSGRRSGAAGRGKPRGAPGRGAPRWAPGRGAAAAAGRRQPVGAGGGAWAGFAQAQSTHVRSVPALSGRWPASRPTPLGSASPAGRFKGGQCGPGRRRPARADAQASRPCDGQGPDAGTGWGDAPAPGLACGPAAGGLAAPLAGAWFAAACGERRAGPGDDPGDGETCRREGHATMTIRILGSGRRRGAAGPAPPTPRPETASAPVSPGARRVRARSRIRDRRAPAGRRPGPRLRARRRGGLRTRLAAAARFRPPFRKTAPPTAQERRAS